MSWRVGVQGAQHECASEDEALRLAAGLKPPVVVWECPEPHDEGSDRAEAREVAISRPNASVATRGLFGLLKGSQGRKSRIQA